jgi:hypothetical protein
VTNLTPGSECSPTRRHPRGPPQLTARLAVGSGAHGPRQPAPSGGAGTFHSRYFAVIQLMTAIAFHVTNLTPGSDNPSMVHVINLTPGSD